MQRHDTQEASASVARRRFLAWVGWGSFAAFWMMATLATVRFLFPRVLYEPSPIFRAGKPGDYQVGEISTRFKKDQRVWMIRTSEGFYALVARPFSCRFHTMQNPWRKAAWLARGSCMSGEKPYPCR